MKRLSFRFCRRALLILAILFPIVYLCGGLFSALWGSHGENVLATDDVSIVDKKYLDFNQLVNIVSNNDYISVNDGKAVFNTDFTSSDVTWINISNNIFFENHYYVIRSSSNISNTNDFRFATNGVINDGIAMWNINDSSRQLCSNTGVGTIIVRISPNFAISSGSYVSVYIFDLTQMYGQGNEPSLDDFNIDFPDAYYPYTLSSHITLPVYGVPSEQNMLFYHIFGENNFITDLGRGVLFDTAFGFPPFRDMFNWFNDSVMHIEPDDALGVFGLGYAYYSLNVVAVYELVVLVMMVFLLPLRITDRFMGDKL